MKKDTKKKVISEKQVGRDKRDAFDKALESFVKETTKKLGFKNPIFGYAFLDSEYNGLAAAFGTPNDRAQGLVMAYDLRNLASQIENKVDNPIPSFPNFLSSLLSK
jgi:hypothetical protein